MKKKRGKILIRVLIAIMIVPACAILIHDPILMDSQEITYPDVLIGVYPEHGSYKFDPITILDGIKQGNEDEFTIINESLGEHIYKSPFPWKQSDYLAIANSLHQRIWNESVEGWDLHDMSFYGDCKYEPLGFNIVTISYYKITGMQEFSAHMIGIYPMAGEGEWGGGWNYPYSVFSKWEYFDLTALTVNVEDALRIAEDNGGRQARLSVNNLCRIDLSLAPYPYPRWHVFYSFINANWIFEITIDPYSGEYKVLSTN